MTKLQYLARLKEAVKGMEGADELIEFYREMIEDKIESGFTEEEVCANLESPQTVAESYLCETKGEECDFKLEKFTKKTLKLILGGKLTVDSDNLALVVEPTDGEARLVFWESRHRPKEVSYKDGVLTIRTHDAFVWSSFKSAWKYGIFGHINDDKATVYLPADWCGDFKGSTENGSIQMHGLTLGTVEAESENGSVRIENSAVQAISAQTRNGSMQFISVTGDSLYAKSNNGSIKLDNMAASRVELYCKNGSISGELAGRQSDYCISANTKNGKCNLTSSTGGEKTLIAETGNGSIKLTFSAD